MEMIEEDSVARRHIEFFTAMAEKEKPTTMPRCRLPGSGKCAWSKATCAQPCNGR